MRPSLLPPNASRLERALDVGTARFADIDTPFAEQWNPATMPIENLPFLAWGLSVDSWNPDWSEAVKRQAVTDSIALHRIKGTRLSVEMVLARFDELLTIVEWHEATPRRPHNTFDVRLPIVNAVGVAGGKRVTAAFAEAIIADVMRVKPLREHMTLVQSLALQGGLGVFGTARLASYARRDADLDIDTSTAWGFYLQTEDGEPMQTEAGTLLDTAQ